MDIQRGAPLMDSPGKEVFCGPRKYLRLIEHRFSQRTFPVMEDESYFLLVRSGWGRAVINGLSFPLEPGSVCWIQSTHTVTLEPAYGQELLLWSLEYEYALSNYLMFKQGSEAQHRMVAGCPILPAGSQGARKIERLFEDLENIDQRRRSGYELIKVSILGQISLLFGLELERSGQSLPLKELPLGWSASVYLATHSVEDIDPQLVANIFGTSSRVVERELKMSTGLSFEQNLCRDRCLLAASYFLCDNMPMDYVASRAGFKSQANFFHSFKRTMGVTPGQYRESTLCSGKGGGIYRGMIMDDRLLSVIHYLYENISQPVSLEKMSRDIFISPNMIRSLVKRAFGVSYKDILSLFRVRYAESLLSSTSLYLLDIAIVSGFNSVSTFSRKFKDINHMSPSQFRDACQKRSLADDG